ncbi:DnaA ATPase domain-containing protein [Caulobacter sp. NIBR2454]|uniref:DnaA ATPase domain-containing protein n=1 Tax=Caulobacter sp. NIBR2454 TaxID=3015996 RepID=UPI0022B6FF2A|nr:DnaA/Hda family protein [Caulobacter sp. NIBR2454]
MASPTNREALRALDAWPAWHGGCLALIGPAGVGKSHLAREWASKVDAVAPTRKEPADLASLPGRPVLLENADDWVSDEALFHLINMAAQNESTLLLTSRKAPREWTTTLPDLRSRLNAMPVAEIEEPDDIVLEGVLRKFFRERNIRPAEDVYPYLLRRMQRSVPQALEIVKKLDEAADAEQKAISRVLARQILENDTENLELFD